MDPNQQQDGELNAPPKLKIPVSIDMSKYKKTDPSE
jgi:hypothetical protein